MSNSSLSRVDDLAIPDHHGTGVAHAGTLSLDGIGEQDLRVSLFAQENAERRGDFTGRKRTGGNLV